MRQPDPRRVARLVDVVEAERLALDEHGLALVEDADSQFGALQVRQYADRVAVRLLESPNLFDEFALLVVAAVAEVEPEDIDAGGEATAFDDKYELLEVRSIPLRNYLMQNVIPTLTEGLIEVCKLKPEDPVDYLADYLFKNNPVEEEA